MYGQHPESSPQDAATAVPAPPVSPRRLLLDTALVAGLVFSASCLGILTRPEYQLATFWPTNALLLGLLARRPRLASPAVWAAAALGYVAADLLTGTSLPTTLRLTAANLAGVVAGYLVFLRIRREDRRLLRPLSMLWVLAASAAASLAATVVGGLLTGRLTAASLGAATGLWFSSELVSYAAILPVMLLAPAPSALLQEVRGFLREAVRSPTLLLPALGLAATVAMGVLIGGPGAIAFPVPALLWCALAYRLFTTALFTLLLCVWTLIAVAHGFIDLQLQEGGAAAVVSLRIGMALLAVAPLTVAGVNAARNHLLAALHHAANHDALTGALNRGAFLRHGRAQLESAQQDGIPVAVLMLDIDHFKSVNDRHGHAAGDAVLVAFVQRVRGLLREDDLLGRTGGEEFAVLMPGAGRGEALDVAERLRRNTQAPIGVDGSATVSITLSVGVAVHAPDPSGVHLETLLKRADDALYRAKAAGRDCVVKAGP